MIRSWNDAHALTGGRRQRGREPDLACRDALKEGRGFNRGQAYVLCSVAVDIKISNLVDVPNFVVSASCRYLQQ